MDIAAWLRDLGLARYEETFRENDIDSEVLLDLTEADLEKLGISLGHRKKLLRAIAALQESPGIEQAAGPSATATPQTHVAERRQLTVLFCDLVGSTDCRRRSTPKT